jgi:hypothetical protein
VVIAGEVDLAGAVRGPGLAAVFEPAERHAVRALTDARLLLVLAPWPGEGHPGARDDERTAHVSKRSSTEKEAQAGFSVVASASGAARANSSAASAIGARRIDIRLRT